MEMEIMKGIRKKPSRIVIYGVHGIGKSTFASRTEKAIFLDIEGRLEHIDCHRFPTAKSFKEVKNSLNFLIQKDKYKEYQTLVIDSLDWLEDLIGKQICEVRGISSLASVDYGKAYSDLYVEFNMFLNQLNAFRDATGMNIVAIAHDTIETFRPPDMESYNQYQMSLRDQNKQKAQQWADCIFFANYRTQTTEGKDKVTRAVSNRDRVLYTKDCPAFTAKDSFNLPHEICFNEIGMKELFEMIDKFYNKKINNLTLNKGETKNGKI